MRPQLSLSLYLNKGERDTLLYHILVRGDFAFAMCQLGFTLSAIECAGCYSVLVEHCHYKQLMYAAIIASSPGSLGGGERAPGNDCMCMR